MLLRLRFLAKGLNIHIIDRIAAVEDLLRHPY